MAALAVGLTLALPACGSASDQDQTAPQRTSPDGAEVSAKKGVALKQIGSFDSPVGVTGAPGYPKLLFVVEQEGQIQVLKGGRRAGSLRWVCEFQVVNSTSFGLQPSRPCEPGNAAIERPSGLNTTSRGLSGEAHCGLPVSYMST